MSKHLEMIYILGKLISLWQDIDVIRAAFIPDWLFIILRQITASREEQDFKLSLLRPRSPENIPNSERSRTPLAGSAGANAVRQCIQGRLEKTNLGEWREVNFVFWRVQILNLGERRGQVWPPQVLDNSWKPFGWKRCSWSSSFCQMNTDWKYVYFLVKLRSNLT